MKLTSAYLLIIATFCSVYAQDYSVVVNKSSPLSEVSNSDLKRLYTGKAQAVNNVKCTPVNLSFDNAVSNKFIETVAGMSVVDYKSHWMAEQIRGGSTAPKILKSADAVITFLTENPEGIGYVEKATVTDAVKVLTVK